MFNDYSGWKSAVFRLADKEEKGETLENINYENGKFNKLSDKIHIAIEEGSYDPEGKHKFNQLFIAFKDIEGWDGELPKWNNDYV